MIRQDILGINLRASLQTLDVRETQNGNPYILASLYVIDNNNNPINDKGEDGQYSPIYWAQYLIKKDGDVNRMAVESLKHVFTEWDYTLDWFLANRQNLEKSWFDCRLTVYSKSGAQSYQAESLFLHGGEPYSNYKKADVASLAATWNAKLIEMGRESEKGKQPATQPVAVAPFVPIPSDGKDDIKY